MGIKQQFKNFAKHSIQWLFKPVRKIKWLSDPILRQFSFVDFVTVEQAAFAGKNTRNVRILSPAQRVTFSDPKTDPFTPIARRYREGWFDRPDILVCEAPGAYLCLYNGTVCTRDMEVIVDIEARRGLYMSHAPRKPFAMMFGAVKRLTGLYSSINFFAGANYYHWMADCLPKIHSLAQYEPKARVTLLMPHSTGRVQRESLSCVLPAHFRVEYHPDSAWLQLESFLLPSLVGGYYNGFLPPEYYESIRRPIFERYGLPAVHSQKERLYISRRGAGSRCVLNEEAVLALLQPYGFKTVELDKLSFREQVELFHRADIVIGPSGSGFNVIVFCGKVRLVLLHPNQVPDNCIHTMAKGLGQDYHYVLHHGGYEDSFEVDLPALKRVLEEELSL